jgi:hypothetical protein
MSEVRLRTGSKQTLEGIPFRWHPGGPLPFPQRAHDPTLMEAMRRAFHILVTVRTLVLL